MEIVRTRTFDKDLQRIGLTEEDFDQLRAELERDPQVGDVIRGLRGLRKVRFAIPSRRVSKRSGGRATYLVLEVKEKVYLLTAYAKSEQSDLSNHQRKILLNLIKELRDGKGRKTRKGEGRH